MPETSKPHSEQLAKDLELARNVVNYDEDYAETTYALARSLLDLYEQLEAARGLAVEYTAKYAETKEQLEVAEQDYEAWKELREENLRLEEQLEAADVALDWIAQNHRRVIVEMPSDIFQALRRASVSSPASEPHS